MMRTVAVLSIFLTIWFLIWGPGSVEAEGNPPEPIGSLVLPISGEKINIDALYVGEDRETREKVLFFAIVVFDGKKSKEVACSISDELFEFLLMYIGTEHNLIGFVVLASHRQDQQKDWPCQTAYLQKELGRWILSKEAMQVRSWRDEHYTDRTALKESGLEEIREERAIDGFAQMTSEEVLIKSLVVDLHSLAPENRALYLYGVKKRCLQLGMGATRH